MIRERPYEIWSDQSIENLIQVIISSTPVCLNEENVLDYKYLSYLYDGRRSEMAIRLATKVNWIYIDRKLQEVGLKINRVHTTFPVFKISQLAEVISNEHYQDSAGRIKWRLIVKEVFPDFDPQVLRKAYRYYIEGKLEA